MVVTLASEAVSIKGTKNGLVILFNPELDIEEIKKNLTLKMEKSGGFFRGAKFAVYNSDSGDDHHYTVELEVICRQYGLIPSPEVSWPAAGSRGGQAEALQAKKKKAPVIPFRQHAHPDGEPALLVPRTLRSGQKISSRQSIVVMGDVNPGSEVVSEGSIYILGSCKGSVHAGSAGDLMSEVYALRLQASVLRIGTITAGDPPPAIADLTTARVVMGKIAFSKA